MGSYGLSQSFDRDNTVSTEKADIAVRTKNERNKAALFMGLGLLLIFGGIYNEVRRSRKTV
jgi:hypothetical protein